MNSAILRNEIVLISTDSKLIEQELLKLEKSKKFNSLIEIPVSVNLLSILEKHNFYLSKSLYKWKTNMVDLFAENQLYPFQKKGVEFIENKMGRALIADEMGLGKTVQSLSWLKLHPELRPVLIICTNIKLQWQQEVYTWLKESCTILNGKKPYEIENSNIVIINYDILNDWIHTLQSMNFKVLIFDEAHKIKNNSAKRTKAFKRIAKNISKIIALTGTPIENKPVEIFNIVHTINPFIFPNFMEFAQRYCGAEKGRFGWDFSGATNLQELNSILKHSIMIRRKKKDVLKDLPPKQIVKVVVEIDNTETYVTAERKFIEYLHDKFNRNDENVLSELKNFAKKNKIEIGEILTDQEIKMLKQEKMKRVVSAPILAQIEILKQLAVNGKMKQVIEWIENFLDSGEKLVVFTYHKKTIETLLKHFPDISVKVDGSVLSTNRNIAVNEFQTNPKIKLFFGNLKAASESITLTAASNVAMIEYPWTPGNLMQAADRVHRITQTKQVTIWNIVAINTIEERIINLLKSKEQIINMAIDGSHSADQSILNELILSYKK